jgi:hypothetical protein
VLSACATHIPLREPAARAIIVRAGTRLGGSRATQPGFMQAGDRVFVGPRGRLAFAYGGNRFKISHGSIALTCADRAVTVTLRSGRVTVRSGRMSKRPLVVTPELLALTTARATDLVVGRDPRSRVTRAWTLNRPIVAARASDQRLCVDARVTYTAISDSHGLRLDIWPFSMSPLQRPTAPPLPAFWADGRPCSVGCTAPAVPGWPLKPFHRQHAIRAGINELRPANFHVAVDIEAHNFQPVYAIQSGYASIRYPGTGDVNVDIGRFYYWHIVPAVANGQYVTAYRTVIGHVVRGFGHVALSEGTTADYLNPLRPGGSLRPYHDSEPPVIGVPRVFADGRVTVGAFDPQSFIERHQRYETPVLAPSSLAWRLYDARGRAVTGLEWAMRGSQNYPPSLKPVIFAPGASNPGFNCFLARRRCIPNWVYWLAGGLTPPLPLAGLRGRYRLVVYAWDWAGNRSALDDWIKLPLGRAATPPAAEFGLLAPRFDYQ